MRTYTIEKGDTLSGISYKVYGTLSMIKDIWRMNAHIKDPDQLHIGQKIHLYYQEDLANVHSLYND